MVKRFEWPLVNSTPVHSVLDAGLVTNVTPARDQSISADGECVFITGGGRGAFRSLVRQFKR